MRFSLNLANNVLDAAKLKSNKMEISNTETDFTNVIRKSLVINSETLKAKNITAEGIYRQQDSKGTVDRFITIVTSCHEFTF